MTDIKKTEDYSAFRRIKGNRTVRKSHVTALTEAIKRDAECITYNPILVNEKKEVIDGQHRLEAIQRLGLPVYFIEEKGLDLKNVQKLNSATKVWTPTDYARSFAELGNKHYEFYLLLKRRYKLNHDILLKFISLKSEMTHQMFRDGKLEMTNRRKTLDLCKKHKEFGEFYPKYKKKACGFAFYRAYHNKGYDHARMIEKMRKFAKYIEDYATMPDFLRAIEKVYNHRVRANEIVRLD